MLVNVIPINSVDSFDYFLFPTQNPLHDSYFQQQVETFSNKLTDIGRTFMEGTRRSMRRLMIVVPLIWLRLH